MRLALACGTFKVNTALQMVLVLQPYRTFGWVSAFAIGRASFKSHSRHEWSRPPCSLAGAELIDGVLVRVCCQDCGGTEVAWAELKREMEDSSLATMQCSIL